MKRESCNNCGRPISVCLCKNIIKQTNKTQIVILQHPDEVGHYLNTAIMGKVEF